MPKNHYSHKLGVRFFIFVAEIMNYKKCPKCELNYIKFSYGHSSLNTIP